jgi:murein DD-endopeptidase MepM/ murein hydrolase activator NlpD
MQRSLSHRRRQQVHRRRQIRRRRAVALVALVTLTLLAVWAAYAIPASTPAHIPDAAAQPAILESPEGQTLDDLVVARAGGVDVLLPVAREVTTAVAYHPVDHSNTVPFSPLGDRVSGGDLTQRLADIFAGGGSLKYYLMDGDGDDRSSSTSGLDVGAVPGSSVTSPADGKVVAVKQYRLLGRYQDVEVQIQLAADPSLLLVVTHLTDVTVDIGDVVRAGDSTLGTLRGFPPELDQALSAYTSDAGDHVQLVALRVTPELTGL